MWIPYHGPEPFDEVCDLCGVFSGAHHGRPDPPKASLPCPEPWPGDEPALRCLDCGVVSLWSVWNDKADHCPACGSPNADIDAAE
jgi:hypothetical protein